MEILKYQGFEPDYRNLVNAARNQWVPRIPLYEHIIGANAIYEITGNRPYDLMDSENPWTKAFSRIGWRKLKGT